MAITGYYGGSHTKKEPKKSKKTEYKYDKLCKIESKLDEMIETANKIKDGLDKLIKSLNA